jgi:fructokinase
MPGKNKINRAVPVAVGLGEILWDLLPTGRQLGGAPANVGWHLKQLGAAAFVVSSVGTDALGTDICAYMDRYGLTKEYLSIDDKHPTGTVEVKLDKGLPSYIIHENAAWDYIPWTSKLAQLARDCDAVCFGTLAQRGQSRDTIQKFLTLTRNDCLRIFDINLRQSYYTKELILASLSRANVLKINDEELRVCS